MNEGQELLESKPSKEAKKQRNKEGAYGENEQSGCTRTERGEKILSAESGPMVGQWLSLKLDHNPALGL